MNSAIGNSVGTVLGSFHRIQTCKERLNPTIWRKILQTIRLYACTTLPAAIGMSQHVPTAVLSSELSTASHLDKFERPPYDLTGIVKRSFRLVNFFILFTQHPIPIPTIPNQILRNRPFVNGPFRIHFMAVLYHRRSYLVGIFPYVALKNRPSVSCMAIDYG